jgi:hypothetical protein
VQQFGDTALHEAASRGHLSLVQLLVERAPQLLELADVVSGKMTLRACVMWVAGWDHTYALGCQQ